LTIKDNNGINLAHEQEGCKIKYDNIKNLFNFIDITDKYILIKDREKIKKVYIYEIEPVTLLNFSIDVQSNILNLYSEFLRELNLEFQIYISNKKVNIPKYIESLKNSMSKKNSLSYNNLLSKYISSITEQLEDEIIYNTKYYLVLSIDRDELVDFSTVNYTIKKLNNIGCNVQKINSKRKIETLLYESISKEVVF